MADAPTRVRFSNHQFLDEDDFRDEQTYHMGGRRRHNQWAHTPGVVSGLVVKTGSAGRLDVSAGIAVDPDGREIAFLGDSVALTNDATQYVTLEYATVETRSKTWGGLTLTTRYEERPVLTCGPDQVSGKEVLLAVVQRSGTNVTISHLERIESGPRGPLTFPPPAGSETGGMVLARSAPGTVQLGGSLKLAKVGGVGGDLVADGSLSLSGSLTATAGMTLTGAVRITSGPLTVGSSNQASTARVTIEDSAVPLALRETGQAVNAGGLWRLRLDGGVLGFDVNTGTSETFSSAATPLTVTPLRVGIGAFAPGQMPGSALHVVAPATGAPVTGLTVDVTNWSGNPVAGHLLRLNDFSTGSVPLIVRGDGNVGIGNASPASRLDVRTQSTANEAAVAVTAIASGQGAGTKQGLVAQASGGNLTYGANAAASTTGTNSAFGLQAQASGDGTGQRVGVQGWGLSSAGGQGVGGWFLSATSGDGPATGLIATAYGDGNGGRTGVDASASTGAGPATAFGAQITASTNTDAPATGLLVRATGNGNAGRVGAQVNVDGGSQNANARGMNIAASTDGDLAAAQGLSVHAYGNGKGTKIGLTAVAGGGGGNAIGCRLDAEATGTNDAHALQATAHGNGAAPRVGIYAASAGGAAGAMVYGALAYATAEGDNHAFGVFGVASGAGNGQKIAVYGDATSGGGQRYAGYFNGNVHVNGTLTANGLVKPTGSFLIDHPLDPLERTLRHNLVEAPEDLCLYRGRVQLDGDGRGRIELPSYFTALTDEEGATAYLTPLGSQPFAVSYAFDDHGAAMAVHGAPGGEVAWLVAADRDDPVSEHLRRPVEEEKGGDNGDKGKLLYPEALGEPEELGIHFETMQAAASTPGPPPPPPEPITVDVTTLEGPPGVPEPPEPPQIPEQEEPT